MKVIISSEYEENGFELEERDVRRLLNFAMKMSNGTNDKGLDADAYQYKQKDHEEEGSRAAEKVNM